MKTKKGQAEMTRMLVWIVIAIIAFILIAYFGITHFKTKTKQLEESTPQPSLPQLGVLAPLIFGVGPSVFGFRFLMQGLREMWARKRGGFNIPPAEVISLVTTIVIVIVIIVVLVLFFGGNPPRGGKEI